MSPDPSVRLLAVDLGLRLGWAAFGAEGRLVAYGSRHFASRTALRKAVPAILSAFPALDRIVVEGGGDLALPWEREAGRRGLAVVRVPSETWRAALLPARDRRTGREAKLAAGRKAREIIRRSGAKRPTSLRHDAAEAVLIGTWAVSAPRAGGGAAPRGAPSGPS